MKLSSNEGAFGPLPAAVAAYEAAARELNRYPDGGGVPLREALAERHGVPVEQVVLGNGADELIRLCAVATLEQGDAAAFPWPSFPSYATAAECSGADALRVPLARALRRPRCAARAGAHAAHEAGVPGQSQQPHRVGGRGRARCAAFWMRSPTTCSACSTRPTRSTPTPSPRAPPWCARAARACACCARSRRSTAWRRCASGTPWPHPRWRRRSSACARSST